VSRLSFQDLLTVDVGGVHAASAAWDKLAKDLDDRADDMVAVTKQVPDVWEGVAGERAGGYADELRRDLDAA
jgi:uncharacterized protein YukE